MGLAQARPIIVFLPHSNNRMIVLIESIRRLQCGIDKFESINYLHCSFDYWFKEVFDVFRRKGFKKGIVKMKLSTKQNSWLT